MSRIIERKRHITLPYSSSWVKPVQIVLMLPIKPHRSFEIMCEEGYVWLGFVVYAISSLFSLRRLYQQETRGILSIFHPLQGITSEIISNLTLVFIIEYIIVVLLAAIPAIAARAFFQKAVPELRLVSAILLVLGAGSLLAGIILSFDVVRGFIYDRDWVLSFILVSILIVTISYVTAAIVKIGRMSTITGIATLLSSFLFFPVWFAGIFITLIPGLSATPKNEKKRPPFAGIILDPKSTFDLVINRQPLKSTLLLYVALQLLFFLLSIFFLNWSTIDLPDQELLPMQWGLLFHRTHVLLTYATLSFTPENVGTVLGGLADTLFSPILYPYLLAVPLVTDLLFIAGAHLAIRRTMGVWGRYRDLLQTFLYIVIAAILFLIPFLFLYILLGHNSFRFPTSIQPRFLGFIAFGYYTTFVWLILLQIMAIQQVYEISFERGFGAWFINILLFVPVTVAVLLVEAVMEILRPFRVNAYTRTLLKLRRELLVYTQNNDIEQAQQTLIELLGLYAEPSEVAHRARAEIDLAQPLLELFSVDPETALDGLIALARQGDEDVQLKATKILKRILDSSPAQVVESCYYLLINDAPTILLGRMATSSGPTPATDLVALLYQLITKLNADNLTNQLADATNIFEQWREQPDGDELFLAYRAFHTLSQTTNVTSLQQSEPELVQALDIHSPLLSETAKTLKPLLDISNYLNYYSRAEFENKLPYLAAPIMILVDEDRRLGRVKFPPEDAILRLLIRRLQDIILREFDGLRGRADLHFELKPKQLPFNRELTISLTVRNQGSAHAENMRLEIEDHAENGFVVASEPSIAIDLLEPKRETQFEFTIQPAEPGRLRIPFTTYYSDLERSDRQIPFANVVHLYEPNEDLSTSTVEKSFINPYITGLPVKNPDMFFGREDIFHFIKTHLQGQHEKNIIVLRGQRRTGKTSILYQLKDRLDEKYIPVFIDMQGFASTGVDRFLYWIALLTRRTARNRGFVIDKPRLADYQEDPYGYFRQEFLPSLWTAIDYHHILLAFDEFEEMAGRVEDGKIDKDIFPYLRNLMQHTSQLDFIFAGTHKLQQVTHEYRSILFNIALFRDIGFMEYKVVEQLIKEPVKGTIFYDDLAIEKVNRITAGHPYFVQIIGNKLVDYYLETNKFYLTLQDVNYVLKDVIMGGALHFDYLWHDSLPLEQLLLAAMARNIAREGGVATLAELITLFDRFDLGVRQAEILTAVRSLVTRQLIVTDDDMRQYEFKIDLVRLWLNRYQGFGAAAEMYRDISTLPLAQA